MSSEFVNHWTLACGLACRLVYRGAENRIVSWAYGEGAATTVASERRAAIGTLTAAFTRGGRLWVVWWNDTELRFEAKLGNAAGAGGSPIVLNRPPGLSVFAGRLTSFTIGDNSSWF